MNCLLFSLVLGFGGEDMPRLAVIRPAPDVRLIDQDESPRSLKDYRGKAVLVSFVFTTCTGNCPQTTQRLALVHREVQKRPDLKGRVQFLSITLDPERDRPEVLRNYRELHDIEADSWLFLTGPNKEVQDVMAAWGMWARPGASGQLDHPSRVFLVDGRGRIREIYNLEFLRPPWVLEDIEELLQDK